jgi:redox-sensitive bicupin YhaK (pirin superfamily)
MRCISKEPKKQKGAIMKTRRLETVYTPSPEPGFLGNGHVARRVIQVDFAQSDPFILLMDDQLNKKDNVPSGGPHPHAGFETVTLLLEGEIGLGKHALQAGDFEIMTAGSGIVHTEVIDKPTKMRLLQLWLNLPKAERHAQPRLQTLKSAQVPSSSQDGVGVRVYSGNFAGLTSPIDNYTPLIVAELKMQPGASFTSSLPADFSTFLYIFNGSVSVGERSLSVDQVGWLDRADQSGDSTITLTAGEKGARFVLYAAQPQRHEIVSHGPFIADSMEEIKELYAKFRRGQLGHITEVPEERLVVLP